jgi:hypothetical protein
MNMSLKSDILKVLKRTKKGFTTGEIYDRLEAKATREGGKQPLYHSVRARVYELNETGAVISAGFRADTNSGVTATAFRVR